MQVFAAWKADPDLWLRPAVKSDGTEFYEYILCYVNDCCYSGLKGLEFMDYLSSVYMLKEGSVKVPETYLGVDVWMYELANEENAWAASSDTYVKRVVAEVERELSYIERQLKSNVKSPFPSGYRPDLDLTPELDPRHASYYASVMGVLHWCVELGQLDIMIEVQMLASFQVCPKEGHLETVFHVFSYLK
jgi:hypothetical protein